MENQISDFNLLKQMLFKKYITNSSIIANGKYLLNIDNGSGGIQRESMDITTKKSIVLFEYYISFKNFVDLNRTRQEGSVELIVIVAKYSLAQLLQECKKHIKKIVWSITERTEQGQKADDAIIDEFTFHVLQSYSTSSIGEIMMVHLQFLRAEWIAKNPLDGGGGKLTNKFGINTEKL